MTSRPERWALALVMLAAGCASMPPAPPAPTVSPVAWEQKLGWIMRLEDQRILRDPSPPPPPAVLQPATARTPAVLAPPPPSDLIRLLTDSEARVRRRAALAIGRVGLAEGVQPLSALLSDAEFEVRQMAAFALGLIGDASARPALLNALRDTNPIVRGRAAEALGMIGDRADADAISALVRETAAAGGLASLDPDDLTYPLSPEVEAARLGLYALARLKSYEALAAAVLDGQGRPIARWWPIAYALQRIEDPRAVPALLTLMGTPGRYTSAFAVRGLGATKATQAASSLREAVAQRKSHPAVVMQAIRALAAMGDAEAAPILTKLVADPSAGTQLRVEAMTALGTIAGSDSVDLLVELLLDPLPAIRGTALRTLARVEPETFMVTLAGLDPDRDWTVRSAIASSLSNLPGEQTLARLRVMLQDRDTRVVAAVVGAVAASKPPGADKLLLEQLRADDFVVRTAAANALADLKVAAAVPALVEAYRAAIGDSTYVARAAILGALARLDPAAARPVLDEALKDREWAVRVRAATLLRERGVPADDAIRPATAGRPVDDPEWQALVSPRFSPQAIIETDKGAIEIQLAILDAPLTVNNFITLARKGFFNGVAIHRVVPDFVVQDGDPRGDGEGGAGYTIRDELNELPYLRGTVGMALDWEDTGGSQFFITHSPQPHLDARYTVFGQVLRGMDVVDQLVQWDVVRRVRIRDGVTPD